MSQTVTLKAETRTRSGKGVARKLRAVGRIPAVVYGQGHDAITITVDAHEADLLFHRISVENTIVELDIDGQKERIPTLVRDVQVHPFKPNILHIDFYKFEKGVEVEVEIPLHLHGTAPGVKLEGGRLQQVIHDLPVACIPSLIPDEIVYDVSHMKMGDVAHVSDLEIPEGVRVTIDPERTIVVIDTPRAIEDEDDDEDEDELEGEEGEGEDADAEGGDEGESDED